MTQRRLKPIRKVKVTLTAQRPPASLSGNNLVLLEALTPPAEDPRAAALARIEAARKRQQEDDAALQARNSDVVRLDDPVGRLSRADMISQFDTSRTSTTRDVVGLMLDATAQLSSLPDVEAVIRNVIGESAEMDATRAEKILRDLHELRFLEQMALRLNLNETTRQHLIERFIDREWGPKPAESRPVVVQTTSAANSQARAPVRRAAATAEPRPSDEGRGPGVRTSRGIGVGPFGAV